MTRALHVSDVAADHTRSLPSELRCRWVQVTIFNSGSPASAELQVDVAPWARGADWQAIRPAYRLATGENHLRIFAGQFSRTLALRAAPEVLAQLELKEFKSVTPPSADEAGVPVSCLTVAQLQECGVRELRDLVLTDDPKWPLRSTGSDPQLRFARPRRGFCRLIVQLETEFGTASPAVYCNNGSGFASHTVVDMSRRPEGWACTVRFSRRCVGWRLDPMAREGLLRVTRIELRVDIASNRWALPNRMILSLKRHAQLLRARVRGYLHANELVPRHQLIAKAGASNHYHASGPDPFFHLPNRLRAGWYLLEARLNLPLAGMDARIYLNAGAGESEAYSFGLPLRSGHTAKRLLWVRDPSHLRFDPMTMPGDLSVEHFRVQRVAREFACDEMRRQLLALHPRFRAQEALSTDSQTSALPLPDGIEELWKEYHFLFENCGAEWVSYADWIEAVEGPALPTAKEQAAEATKWRWHPRFSIILPTYNTPIRHLRECLDGVLAQTYGNWELCIADDASSKPGVCDLLREYANADSRVRVVLRETNGHISASSNSALDLASGDFVVLLDHDDVLPAHALFFVAQALQQRPSAQLIYSDEDKLNESGHRCQPFFKPDWSPDLLYSQNFFSHLGVYRRELVQSVGGFRTGFEGSQDYDLVLRCVARVNDPRDIVHVPHVLYHWRMVEGSTSRSHSQKDYASDAGRRALQDFFDTNYNGVKVETIRAGIYRHRWPLPEVHPLVSLIVPTRDGIDVLRKCIDSILRLTTYRQFEVLVVDNQSTCKRTLKYLEGLRSGSEGQGHVRVLRYDHPFNYSAINNFAATHARGSVLGLVNDDVEVISSEWLTELVSHAVRPDVGCVGAKLYYPDDTIQHAGVVLGLGGVANHAMRMTPRNSPGYFGRLLTVYNPSAVTAAVMLVRKSVFDAVQGLDANDLPIAFNDVDLCLKVMVAGYRNLWSPFAELYHHESVSRGLDESPEKRARFLGEIAVMFRRWGALLQLDPYYNPNLARSGGGYSLALAKPTFGLEALNE